MTTTVSIAFLAFLCVASVLPIAFTSTANVVNKKIDRTIDVSTQLVKITCRYQVENNGKEPLSSYTVQFDATSVDQLAHIGASVDKHPVTVTASKQGDSKVWIVNLGEKAIASGAVGTIDVDAVFTQLLTPFPAEISQAEKQLVLYSANHYVDTPYLTKTQTTKVKLPVKSAVESFSKLKPAAQSADTITYGPYENIAAGTHSKMEVHFENSSPFLTVTRLERTIEISHWGSVISVTEDIDIRHSGAQLKGSFSRYEYQRESGSGSSSIKNFKTKLPRSAFDVYYRDEIGNISTSNMKKTSSNVVVDLRPRFPLFGGWKTHYILGYSVPASDYLFNDGNQLILRMPFTSHLYDNMVIEEATVKVVLPEGASDVKLRLPFSITREKDQTMKSYLDTFGRTVIVLKKSNLVENHIQDFEIHYSYNRLLMLQEPLLIVGALFLLCCTIVVYIRLDFNLSKNPIRDASSKVSLVLEVILNNHDKRVALYGQYDQATSRYKVSRY